MKASFGKAVIRRRWWIIAAAVVFLVATAWGVLFLETTSDTRIFFSEKNPQLKALEAFEDTYTRDENAFIGVEAKEGDVFTPETLAAIEELTEAAWQIPYSRRVDSITNFQHTWAQEDDLVVENLVQDALELSQQQVERIKKIALSEPLLVHRLIASSGKVTGINITTAKPGEAPEENIEVAQYVSQMTKDFREKHLDLNVYITGGVMLDQAFLEATEKDMSTLVPIMFAVMAAATAILIRSLSGTFVTLLIIIASALTAMGLAGWYGMEITPATAVAPIIILTLAVAAAITANMIGTSVDISFSVASRNAWSSITPPVM